MQRNAPFYRFFHCLALLGAVVGLAFAQTARAGVTIQH